MVADGNSAGAPIHAIARFHGRDLMRIREGEPVAERDHHGDRPEEDAPAEHEPPQRRGIREHQQWRKSRYRKDRKHRAVAARNESTKRDEHQRNEREGFFARRFGVEKVTQRDRERHADIACVKVRVANRGEEATEVLRAELCVKSERIECEVVEHAQQAREAGAEQERENRPAQIERPPREREYHARVAKQRQ